MSGCWIVVGVTVKSFVRFFSASCSGRASPTVDPLAIPPNPHGADCRRHSPRPLLSHLRPATGALFKSFFSYLSNGPFNQHTDPRISSSNSSTQNTSSALPPPLETTIRETVCSTGSPRNRPRLSKTTLYGAPLPTLTRIT